MLQTATKWSSGPRFNSLLQIRHSRGLNLGFPHPRCMPNDWAIGYSGMSLSVLLWKISKDQNCLSFIPHRNRNKLWNLKVFHQMEFLSFWPALTTHQSDAWYNSLLSEQSFQATCILKQMLLCQSKGLVINYGCFLFLWKLRFLCNHVTPRAEVPDIGLECLHLNLPGFWIVLKTSMEIPETYILAFCLQNMHMLWPS